MKILQLILCLLFPPIAVYLIHGAGKDLVINILLTIIGGIPGVIHALYLWLKDNKII